jgi:hypothetical protein
MRPRPVAAMPAAMRSAVKWMAIGVVVAFVVIQLVPYARDHSRL